MRTSEKRINPIPFAYGGAMRRSALETQIIANLSAFGWGQVNQRTQASALPGVTPARANADGIGRGSVVFDVEKAGDNPAYLSALVAGLKASKARPTTITITTGTAAHIAAVVKAGETGLDIPIFVVVQGDDKIEAALIKVGEQIRANGVQPRTTGQGRGRGSAAAIDYGTKKQTSAAGKTYEYVSLAANVRACGAEWRTFATFADLAQFIGENAEEIMI